MVIKVRSLSEDARLSLEFVKAHPGVQARYVAAQLNIPGEDVMIALTILQGRELIEARLDLKYDKRKHADDSAIRFYAKI